jgi:hypothetical protein
LISHDKDESKSYFEQVVLIVSKDENLTKGHVRYLEAKLIEIIRQNGQAQLKNGNLGQPVSLPESDQADMEYFLQQIRVVLPVLGLTFLQEPPKRNVVVNVPAAELKITASEPEITVEESPTFELTSLNGQLVAEAYESEGMFVVKRHSSVRNPQNATPTVSAAYHQRVKQLSEAEYLLLNPDFPETCVLLKDVAFTSPSGASEFVTGARTSGPMYWKVKGTGQTYGEWRAARLDAASATIPEEQEVMV